VQRGDFDTLMNHPIDRGSSGRLLPVHERGGSCAAAATSFYLSGGNHLTARSPATIVAPVHLQDTLQMAVAWGG